MKKRIISLLLICIFALLCFAGCGAGEATIYPKLSAETAKAGDTVTVEVYADNCKRLCATDMYLSFDPSFVELVSYEEQTVEDLYSVLGDKEDDVGNPYLMYSCYTLETIDLKDCLLFSATFTVKADAPVGESYFGIAVDYFNKGDDAKGTTYTNIESEIVEGGVNLVVTVAE